MSGNVKL